MGREQGVANTLGKRHSGSPVSQEVWDDESKGRLISPEITYCCVAFAELLLFR